MWRRVIFVQLLLCGGYLYGGEVQSSRQRGNVLVFQLADGQGELEWVSASSFRFSRFWGPPKRRRAPIKGEKVDVSRKDLGAHLEFSTSYFKLEIEKSSLRVTAKNSGERLMADLSEVRKVGGAVILERTADPSEKYYGLGLRATPNVDLRGQKIKAGKPFLISSRGYAEYYTSPGTYTFDLASSNPDRRRVTIEGGDSLEYFFYYGPSPKEILEEHLAVAGGIGNFDSADFGILESSRLPKGAIALPAPKEGSWASLRESAGYLAHASMSAFLLAAFDLSPYQSGPEDLFSRAAQLGSVMPILYASSRAGLREAEKSQVYKRMAEMRKRLTPLFLTYAQEAQERGFPVVRPLVMQFPKDDEALRRTDEFMIGDELLVAPAYSPEAREEVYLPQGIWTDLRTNELYRGRQTVRLRPSADEPPMFGRNGTILPLAPVSSAEPMTLSYFPKLAAELFVFEEDAGDYSIFHAGPALDVMRLESESLKDHTYEWIVHHWGPCRKVAVVEGPEYTQVNSRNELRPGAWFYDQVKNNLHIRTRVTAKQDQIINIWPL